MLYSLILILAVSIIPAAGQISGTDDIVYEVYLAKAGVDGLAGESATEFLTTDIPIFCVVKLTVAEAATVRMNLVVVDVAGVKAETKVVSTSYVTKNGEDRVNFSGRPKGNWVAGRYRADIFVDDKLVRSLEFPITQPVTKVKANGFVRVKNSSDRARKRN